MKKTVVALALGALLIPAMPSAAYAQSVRFHADDAHFHSDAAPPQGSNTDATLMRVDDRHDDNRNDDHRGPPGRDDDNRGPPGHDNDRHGPPPGAQGQYLKANKPPAHAQENAQRINRPSNNRTAWRGWSNRDHDIRAFRTHDEAAWRRGHWWHGRHNGVDGVWWIVGNLFYNYPQAVYPYPDPYVPPPVLVEGAPYGDYWYYCADPSGYYPYVQECYTPWRAVPQ